MQRPDNSAGPTVKSGAEHIRAVQDGRAVYLDGERIPDVTTHPAYRNSVASAAALYDYQAQPGTIERMTFDIGGGRRVNRCWQLPHTYEELVERRHALVAWAEQTFGFMGRSPDHVASSLAGQVMGIEVFRNYDENRARALLDYFDYASSNDLFLTYVINNVQGDRSKGFSDQGDGSEDLIARIVDENAAGITIRGAKLFATSAIMANEIYISSGQPLKPGEEHLAFSCALPMNAPGLRMLSRKSYEAHAVSEFDNPLSSRFDENDALIFFDDVKVPWERVFVHRNTDMCRAQFHDTPGHVYQNYQAQIRLSVKLRFLIGLARGVADTIGTTAFPPVRETLGKLASQAAMIQSMVYGMEAAGQMRGPYYLPDRHLLYAAQVQSQEMYPQIIQAIRELAGGALLMLPSSVRDFAHPDLARIIQSTQISPAMTGMDRVKLLKLVWDAVGSEFASRHLQYESFYAGAQFVTRGHSFRTYDWDAAGAMVQTLMHRYPSPTTTGETPMPDLPALATANATTAWLGGDLQNSTDWIYKLTPTEIADLDQALRIFQSRGIALEDATQQDFPLPVFSATLQQHLQEIRTGRGFVVLRGLPVERYSDDEVGIIFYGLGLYLGEALKQNPKGDMLGHVYDHGRTYGQIDVRGYETNAYLPFHTDGCEIVGLLCLRRAKSGGLSAISSATSVYQEIARQHPEYLPALHKGYPYIRREAALTDDPVSPRVPVYGVQDGLISCRCVPTQIEAAAAKLGKPLEGLERKALDLFLELSAATPYRLDMDLEVGDIQLCNNYTTLHSRTGFEDWPEPERRRHMLRLWLALREPRPLAPEFPRQLGYERNNPVERHLQVDKSAMAQA